MNNNDWVRTHKIHLEKITESDIPAIKQCLDTHLGVQQFGILTKKNRICVKYDMCLVDYETLVESLESAGFTYKQDWLGKTKKAWIRFVDQTARKNSQHRPVACCNRPPHTHKAKESR